MIEARVAVVGAGIAGASLAAEIAPHASVVVIEAEDQPGVHATGRSAAFWSQTYGGPLIQPLTSASGGFLRAPPRGFSEQSFVSPRGAIHVGRGDGADALDALAREFDGSDTELVKLSRSELRSAIPRLRGDWTLGLAEPECSDIDVAALHGAYLAALRRAGGRVLTGAPATAVERIGRRFRLTAGKHAIACDILVNAAGAWADNLAALAGARLTGLTPHRRTMVQLRVDPPAPANLPLVIDIAGRFYFKGEAGGRVWLSPHDETACPPCDAAAEEIDIATAIARFEEVVDWRVERVERSWAGLRTFAPDRLPVYGWDASVEGLFWCAGQGGFGIQTAPAAAKMAAAVLLGADPEAMVADLDPRLYSPARFG